MIMKKFFVSALMLLCSVSLHATTQKREMQMQRLQQEFVNPSSEFRSAPLWVWNTDVTTQDIDRMLQELKDQGFGGALVHPRPGLVTEYLSDEWFRLWKYALEKGKELGLKINIYDENSYPSGFAGGHVPDQMPESYNQGQALIGQRSSVAPKPGDCYLCLKRQGDEFLNITDELSNYQHQEGIYYIYHLGYNGRSTWTAGFPYVDLMAKGVTEKFIDITMGAYEKALGKSFGREVNITFTDEPNIASPDGRHCRWTPDLFSTFEQLWGYDLRTCWPALGEEVGDWQKVRHDYNATLLHLFIERWSKPWHAYTEKKNMYWTGHYWEHNWPDLSQGPDNMAMYAWHQLPAIDMLFNQYNDVSCQAQFGNVRSVKELRSVANQMGYVRTLSETYGGGGWDETFADFKRLGDWEYALGVNFMNQHLCHMTITGARKYDYPPVFTSVSPWWQNYGTLNDHFARLSLVLSQGEQQNDWLVLEPTTSLWLHYTQVAGGDPLWRIANAFQQFVTRLEKAQVEYDLGCEDIMARWGTVKGNRLCVGKRAYSTVVLPPEMQNLESSTLRLLKTFAKNGGRVIALSHPTKVSGADDDSFSEIQSQKSCLPIKDAADVISLYGQDAKVKVEVLEGKDVYHQSRQYADGQLLFLVNSSLRDEARVKISLPGKYLYAMDTMTGEVSPCLQQPSGNLSMEVAMEPAGSQLYFASARKLFPLSTAEERQAGQYLEIPASSPVKVTSTHQNAINLDFCNLNLPGKRVQGLYTQQANHTLWKHYGMDDPWETAVQFRHDVLDRDTFQTGELSIEYPFFVQQGTDLTDMHAIVERPDVYSVLINGVVLSAQPDTLLDARMGRYDLSSHVKEGVNIVTLHLSRMKIMAEVAPVILMGNFTLNPSLYGFSLAPQASDLQLGSWKTQGWQEYAWGMNYTQHFNVNDLQGKYCIRLGKWEGTVAEVWVNDQKAGIVYNLQQPDVTKYLRVGDNEVTVRVIGSLKNLYGPHYSDARGIMSPWMWNNVATQRSGKDYDLRNYGLYTPFKLLNQQ